MNCPSPIEVAGQMNGDPLPALYSRSVDGGEPELDRVPNEKDLVSFARGLNRLRVPFADIEDFRIEQTLETLKAKVPRLKLHTVCSHL